MTTNILTSSQTLRRTDPGRSGPTDQSALSELVNHGAECLSCKLSLHPEAVAKLPAKLTALAVVEQAAAWARFIEQSEAVHHRDLESARLRLEIRFGISPYILWKWRNRPPLSIDLSEFVQLAGIVEVLCTEQAKKASDLANQAADALQTIMHGGDEE